ncbi:MAG: GMC oxidoreductase [Mycobacterium sp.]
MITSGLEIEDGAALRARLVVIGAGPAGIVSALEASRRGVEVILIETGNRKQRSEYQNLSVAHLEQPDLHAPVELTVSRQIGGTSTVWGGRCVPYDPVDFAARDTVPDSVWPVKYQDLEGYFQRVCEWFLCGRAVFDVHELGHLPTSMIPGLADGAVTTSSLERWSLPTDFGKVYFDELRDAANVTVITDSTCVRINLDDDQARVRDIECKTLSGRTFTVAADDVIVATGGLEATRLLMCSPGRDGKSIGDHSDQLGHWYMAHLEGVIAELALTTPVDQTIYWYERDTDGSYVRRRFAFEESYLLEHNLNNISGWIANRELGDASHGNARLSFTYLALLSPLGVLLAPPAQRLALTGTKVPGTPYGMASRSPISAHLMNMVRHPIDTVSFIFDFGVKRMFARGRRPPGFFVLDRANRYPLQYHAEHLPHYESQVKLADDVDELGMRKLDIDIAFTDEDVDGVLAAHRHWDDYLRASGVGHLDYVSDDPASAVRARTGGGFHQVGTTRMSHDPADGVVDANLAVHGVPNLHVASSSVFVTSGQANSTFMIVAFVLRLMDSLYETGDLGSEVPA